MMNYHSTMRGFTLVETLVAITILTLAVIAPFQAIQNAISASRIAKQKLIASGLAQEGLEYVRFIRMSNYLASPVNYTQSTLLTGMNSAPNCITADCTVDAATAPPGFAACGGACPALHLDVNGAYTQAAGVSTTIYVRSVRITKFAGYEQVTATISWTDHGANSMVLRENMYDWF
jgi:prepilin-type N-terminal cleavage/methylation domain-containing protein